MSNMSSDIEYFATIIVELYENQKIRDFKPQLTKGMKREAGINVNSSDKTKNLMEIKNYMQIFVDQEYSNVSGKEKLDIILKKTIQCGIQPKVELTENGKMKEELKKTKDILETQINNLKAKNINEQFDKEIEKYEKNYVKICEKLKEILDKGDFERTIDYRKIAIKSLEILNMASEEMKIRRENRTRELSKTELEGRKLHDLVNEKFGLIVDRKERWQKEKEMREYDPNSKNNNLNLWEQVISSKLGIVEEKKEWKDMSHTYFVEKSRTKYGEGNKKKETKNEPKLYDLYPTNSDIKETKNIGCWSKKMEILNSQKEEIGVVIERRREVIEKNNEDEWTI